MNTPAHVVVNLAVLGRKDRAGIIAAVLCGALLPDVPMILFYGYAKLAAGIPEAQIWSTTYHLPQWQAFFDFFNSLPLIAAGYLIARVAGAKRSALLFASMALHCLSDLLLHHDDAHRHLFPFSDWRFRSPVSYWDPQHYGHILGPLEAVVVLAGCMWLLKRYSSLWSRLLTAVLASVYMAFRVYVRFVWAG